MFSSIYETLVRRAWLVVILLCLAGGGWAVAQFGKLGIEFQTTTLLDQKDPELRVYEKLHETRSWSQNEFVVVCASGLDWVSPEGAATLQELVADLEAGPEVGHTMSLLTIPLLRQTPERKPNLLAFAATGLKRLGVEGVDYEAARAELLEHELATPSLISGDGRHTNILVYLRPPEAMEGAAGESASDTQERWKTLVNGVRKVREQWAERLPTPPRLAGVPLVYTYIMERVAHDLRLFGVAAAALFSLGLFLVYRRIRFVLLPLLTSVLPVLAVLGIMAVKNLPFTVITSNLPLLLFVISLPYTIYLVERYLERRHAQPNEENISAIVGAARSVWMPCVFSSLTTIAGFAAFTTSGISPVRTFGTLMAVGTLIALILVFVFLPSALKPWRPENATGKSAGGHGSALSRIFAQLALARPRTILVFSAVLFLLSIVGAFRLTAENKFTSYFWPSSDVYQGLEFIDQNLGGTSTLEVYLTSPKEGHFKTPEGLAAVAAVERFFHGTNEVGSLRSLPALLREARKTLKTEWFPTLNDTTVMNMVQGMAPELFQDIMTPDGRTASLQVRFKETSPTLNRRRIIDGLDNHLNDLRGGPLAGLEVETTGIFVLYANMLGSLIDSQRDTLGFVVVAIYLMLLALFRHFRLALVVLLPQALPAVTMLGVMGWAGIPLDLVTVMIAAIAIGVGVDSAIQYTMRYSEEIAQDGDPRAALERTHATVGRAIWIATSIIVLGFAVLVTSDFFPSVWFGLLTGLAMLMSQFSALLTLPSLFLWLGRKWRLFGSLG
ncbi:MAG: efflux RND transporter permease subunit [Verrucomicrobiales bacterium]